MSTRTRITLLWPNGFKTHGARAVCELAGMAALASGFQNGRKMLHSLKGMTKKEKLLFLAPRLPPLYTLTLIQEPRHTRKHRSMYWKKREGG
jgi:hypothetical protein